MASKTVNAPRNAPSRTASGAKRAGSKVTAPKGSTRSKSSAHTAHKPAVKRAKAPVAKKVSRPAAKNRVAPVAKKPAPKKVIAKKAAAPKPTFVPPQRATRKVGTTGKAAPPAASRKQASRSKALQAKPLDEETSRNVTDLVGRARADRTRREEVFSDVVVVAPDRNMTAESSEVQTVAALSLGQFASLVADTEPGPVPTMDVVRRMGAGLAMRANQTALRFVRRSSPGLRIFSSTYLYPQRLRTLGEDLSDQEVSAAGGPSAQFSVQLRDPAGNPIAGVSVQAMLDWIGTNVGATTDAQGLAPLVVPTQFARVELLMVEPAHSYWSQFAGGFDMATAPQVVNMTLLPLLPDGFQLMPKYAAHDPAAGLGVRVGVIDTGVGPHVDLTVAGGGCFITGEDATDFLDNGVGHGTHVAGIIAGKLSANGLYGVAPGCTLMAYRVCPKTGNRARAQSIDVAAALEQATLDQCDLVNISLGSLEAMPELPEVLEKARNAGVAVFAATGNDGQGILRYPARYSHTLAVGALGRDATFPQNSPEKHQSSAIRDGNEFVAVFSNYGVGTDFIGVGVAVLSTYPNNLYAMMSGTSMATPFTTGMAARLLSRSPALLAMPRGSARVDAIIAMLCQATRKPAWQGIYDGFGVLK